ncbi:MAG: amidase [Rhodospirillaceae bacterium]|nr:amidase [Rhodospirillaceae bacterium]
MAKMLSWSEWSSLDAIALAKRIRSGEISAKEAAQQVAAGIAQLNPKLRAVLEVFEEVVANPDTDGPDRAGPFYGVPLLLKDVLSGLKGRKLENGSRQFRGNVAQATDPLIENYLGMGLVPIGRSTTPEFGWTFDTTTDYLDELIVTRSPWNLERTPGGSSGGSAAMVSAGVLPISMASDGGGSIRIPASFSGLVGHKPSRGLVPRNLSSSEYMTRHVYEGVVTRTVRDTALALDGLARGPEGGFFIRATPAVPSFLAAIGDLPTRWRIGFSCGSWGARSPVDAAVVQRLGEVAKLLESLGHTVEEVKDADLCDFERLRRGYTTHNRAVRRGQIEAARQRGQSLEDLAKLMSPTYYQHMLTSQETTLFDLQRAFADNNASIRSFGHAMATFDALLTPTLSIRVPKANGPYSPYSDEPFAPWFERLYDACRYTIPGNETGMPSVSVPAGLDADGMPIGALLHGKFGRDDMVLRLAAQIEAAKPEWFSPRPRHHIAANP